MTGLKQRNVITAATAVAGLVIASAASAVSAPAVQATAAQATQGPAIKLIAAQHTITVPRFGNQVFVDPGIWVASLGAPLQLNVGRASYTDPVTITQVIGQPGLPPQTRPLPASVLDGWNGLKNFISLTIKNKAGRVVATTRLTLCPDSFDPERASPDSPSTSPYPQQCAAMDPFQIGTVWGIEQGWAVNAAQFGRTYRLALGTYRVTESITSAYTQLFGIPPADATATVVMNVVKGSACCAAGRTWCRFRPGGYARPMPRAMICLTSPPPSG